MPWKFIPWHCNGAKRCASSLPLCSRLREAQTLHAGPYSCHVGSCQSTAAAPSTVPDCCLCKRSREAQVPHVDPYSCHNSSCQSLETTLCAVPDRSPRLLPLCSRSHEAQMLNANSNSCHGRQSRSTATFLRCARLLPLSSQPREAQMLHNDPYSCRGRPCHSTAMVSCNIPDCRLRAIDHAELRRCTLNQTHAAAVDAIAPQRRHAPYQIAATMRPIA